jgi:hypothetical protein
MKEVLILEGQFCTPDENDSNLSEVYERINELAEKSSRQLIVAKCKVDGLKSPQKVYLGEIGNLFLDDDNFGFHFEGELQLFLTRRMIDKFSLDNFQQVHIPDVFEINVKDITLYFFPYRWLY